LVTATTFTHPQFRRLDIADIPLNSDLIVMDEKWIADYEREWVQVFNSSSADPYTVRYITPVSARSVGDGWVELSWYVNINDRFHEVPLFLPEDCVVACVDVPAYDEKPHVFVRSAWLADIHEKPLATFALVDAIGIKDLLQKGRLSAASLRALRTRFDDLAAKNPQLGFISFADALIVKQVWSIGQVGSSTRYTYSPESLFPAISDLQSAISDVLGVGAYTVMTQGMNAYDDHAPLHISAHHNHISLNSLGVPFAQLLAIETAARQAIRTGKHGPCGLYMDSLLHRSLKLDYGFRESLALWPYESPITRALGATYVATSIQAVLGSLT
jgi:hypothetical protein